MAIMLRQSNSGSPVPSPIDIDTPEGSVSGANETQYTYPWTENQQQIIQNYREYYKNMAFFMDDLDKTGPAGKSIPKKPKSDMKSLFGDNKKSKEKLSGHDLHEYLVNSLAKQDNVTCPKVSVAGLRTSTSLKDILDNLRSGYDLLKNQNSCTLSASLDYGEWLNVAFKLYQTENMVGKISGTWKEWLEKNVGIQDSYARKLREITKLLGKYPRFRALGLSFSEVYQRRKQIQGMLTLDTTAAQYWQQAN